MLKPQIAQLGYIALESSDIEKSVAFFQKVIGLELTEKVEEQYYFRAWGDFQHHTLSISPGTKGRVKSANSFSLRAPSARTKYLRSDAILAFFVMEELRLSISD